MPRYVIPVPPLSGLLSGQEGYSLDFSDLEVATVGVQLELQLNVAGSTDTVVRVGDGVSDVTGTVTSGSRSASVDASAASWAAGQTLQVEITSAGTGALTLSGGLEVST